MLLRAHEIFIVCEYLFLMYVLGFINGCLIMIFSHTLAKILAGLWNNVICNTPFSIRESYCLDWSRICEIVNDIITWIVRIYRVIYGKIYICRDRYFRLHPKN